MNYKLKLMVAFVALLIIGCANNGNNEAPAPQPSEEDNNVPSAPQPYEAIRGG